MAYIVELNTILGTITCIGTMSEHDAEILRLNIGVGEKYMKNHCCDGRQSSCVFLRITCQST